MAANANAEYKLFKYYEGLCSSGDFPKEIAKVLALGVKSKEARDLDGNLVQKPFTLPKRNWDIVYPAPDDAFKVDSDNMTTAEYEAKILNQVSKVTDTVILKTRTTDKPLTSEEIDDLTVDPDSNKSYLEMYLEIYKPTYIANPEEYPLDCERQGIIPKLITKELYEEKFRTHHAYEDALYMDEVKCTVEPRDDESLGTVNNLTYDEVDKYVTYNLYYKLRKDVRKFSKFPRLFKTTYTTKNRNKYYLICRAESRTTFDTPFWVHVYTMELFIILIKMNIILVLQLFLRVLEHNIKRQVMAVTSRILGEE